MPDTRVDPAFAPSAPSAQAAPSAPSAPSAADGIGQAAPRRILRVDASARTDGSSSRRLVNRLVAALATADGANIVTRDLAAAPPPLLTEAWIDAAFTPEADRSAEQRAALAASDALVAELQAADELVIGVPIYNFGVPAALKAWIDQVARARVTFRYTENGPEGLLTGKRAWLVVASGGTELDGPVDFATGWLRQVLGFLGIHDVRLIAADRQMVVGPERLSRAEAALDAAVAQAAGQARAA